MADIWIIRSFWRSAEGFQMLIARPGGEAVQKFCAVPQIVAALEAAIQERIADKYGLRQCIPMRVEKMGVNEVLRACITFNGPFPGREEILARVVLET